MSLRLVHIYTLRLLNKLIVCKRRMDYGTSSSSTSQQLSDEYTEVFRRLPLKLQLAYGVGHVLNDVCASMWFTYLIVFFHYVLQFSNWETGFLLLTGQVADALATPFVGFHSDQSDNFWICRYGRRKVWHLIGTICVLGAFPFIFAPCPGCGDSSKTALMFYYCIFIIIFQFGWAAVQISHLSLIPELTPNENDRTQLTAIRYCFTVLSNVVVYVITWIVMHINNGENTKIGPQDAPRFQHIVWSVLSLGIVSSIVFHLVVPEEDSTEGGSVRGGQLRRNMSELFCSLEMYQVAVIYMSSRLFVNLSQIFIPLYLHETLNMTASSLALIPLIMFIGSFVTSLGIERINRCFGRKITYMIGTVFGLIACTVIHFGKGEIYITYIIYAIAVVVGAGASVVLVTSLSVTADLIGDRTDSGAFIYGIMSFTDKMANGIAVVIIQDLHSDETSYYRDVLTYVCGGSVILGTVAVITLFKGRTSRDDYEQIPSEVKM